jgi:hypothetical protein
MSDKETKLSAKNTEKVEAAAIEQNRAQPAPAHNPPLPEKAETTFKSETIKAKASS